MDIQKYFEEMTNIQAKLLYFLDHEEDLGENNQNLIDNLSQFCNDKYKLKSLLYLLLQISDNHHRKVNFFSKIEKILSFLKDFMQKYFSNLELCRIFKNNKRILLFLFEQNIMKFDEGIVKILITYYSMSFQYFAPEIKQFKKYVKEKSIIEEIEKELPPNFYENRKIGENETPICELIRNDSIEDFIIFVNQNIYPLNSRIKSSIFETNDFLIFTDPYLIEYAAFFGSIQIFNYLRLNGVELIPSLWKYAIHSDNPEIIHILEENHVEPENGWYEIFGESIKCHHNDVANYLETNYLSDDSMKLNILLEEPLKYYNFLFIQKDLILESFGYLCQYDYFILVDYLCNEKNIDVNKKIISDIFNEIL